MDLINITAPSGERRERFFARSTGTRFEVKAAATGATQIDLYDEIGFWGVNAKNFRARLNDIGDGDVVLRINSPGGDVFDGLAIYNDLVSHPGKVRVEVTGLAASIASIIAMAGDEVAIADNAFFMIHNAWTIGIGNRNDFETLAGTLGKIDDAMARTYAARTGTGIRSVKKMMDDETWLTAKDAKDLGFATESLTPNDGAKARFDVSVFAGMPDSLKWPDETGTEPETERDWERLAMRDAGWSRSRVRAFKRALKPSSDGETTTTDEPLRDAGEVNLTALADAVKAVSAAFKK
ncbi:head maturation protease, ClpP-related [Mesorhizobium sp. M00.F.Ca.ET.217.01.1.1]|uniref:head maturation protease, ClpP-related n=1 Tax=Mesorhizobium sp. M00.F.Ca.ET.217.01.1.1 TaxID=2500529 RepID=UPI000FDB3EB7|nr:head maturation protease, ClpP-related [Mesorhizobium sp. M00.F.Ca.ET.217.01.1.1]TGQ19315.1 Clp protease ClpP [Mesorhizobium sp. M00.F.Ca.ET.217.01.1.1]